MQVFIKERPCFTGMLLQVGSNKAMLLLNRGVELYPSVFLSCLGCVGDPTPAELAILGLAGIPFPGLAEVLSNESSSN